MITLVNDVVKSRALTPSYDACMSSKEAVSPPRVSAASLGVLALLILATWGLVQWAGARVDTSDGAGLRALARAGDIHMIGSETCPYCAAARRWLAEQKVPYDECLIEHDRACLAQYEARGGRGTPTFVVRGQTVLGFDRERIAAVLAR